jgi:hypothetical protein
MNERKYRHADGTGRKRYAKTDEAMAPDDLLTWMLGKIPGDGYEPLVSPGVYVTWYSPLTAEEEEQEAQSIAHQQAVTDKWERETYERLREKFEEHGDRYGASS